MRLVVIESPYAGDVEGNVAYARAAVRDCLQRGESPIASHLLFTQAGILDDQVSAERALGIEAGLAWYASAEAAVFYMDKGLSRGMSGAWRFLCAHHPKLPVEWRWTAPAMTSAERMACPFWFRWETPFTATTADRITCETPLGRLEVDRTARAPTQAAPFLVTLNARKVAFYTTREAAKAGAEHCFLWRAANVSQKTHHAGRAGAQ